MRQELDLGHISGCSIVRRTASIAQRPVRSTRLLPVILPNDAKYTSFERSVALSMLDGQEAGD
jgi:hypothetical protein